ncbi:MAG: M64 family metallopeptidase [Salinivirgaceae bacterium]
MIKPFIKPSALVLLIVFLTSFTKIQDSDFSFEQFFEKKVLRIDYELIGDAHTQQFVLKQLKKQNNWAGAEQLAKETDSDFGDYRFSVYDSASNKLLYKNGFSSLFHEWQSTPEADKKSESYYHVNLMPFPRQTIRYLLEQRRFIDGEFETIYQFYINPQNYFIRNESPEPVPYSVIKGGDNVSQKVDLAFVAEGYTRNEMDKFKKDVVRIWNYMSQVPPFDSFADDFNVYALELPSNESGTDIPGKLIYKNTALNFSFFTFNTPRYLTTNDIKALHDAAAVIPYDHLFVLINSETYGGGGFYNYYSASTSDHSLSEKVAIHEFGHGFAGLADEYYDSSVAYDGYYNLKVEPWEPNITTLVNFGEKWKAMLPDGIEIPTERIKKYEKTIGVFEGGGYSGKGIYSPYQDCRMKSNKPDGFCPVCSEAIKKTIEKYTGK